MNLYYMLTRLASELINKLSSSSSKFFFFFFFFFSSSSLPAFNMGPVILNNLPSLKRAGSPDNFKKLYMLYFLSILFPAGRWGRIGMQPLLYLPGINK